MLTAGTRRKCCWRGPRQARYTMTIMHSGGAFNLCDVRLRGDLSPSLRCTAAPRHCRCDCRRGVAARAVCPKRGSSIVPKTCVETWATSTLWLRASDCVARRAAPGSCSARRAQPRRGLDRAEQSIREHGTHNFLWAEECNFMPQPSKMQKRSRGGLRAQIGRVPHTPQDGFTARDQMADGFVISGS